MPHTHSSAKVTQGACSAAADHHNCSSNSDCLSEELSYPKEPKRDKIQGKKKGAKTLKKQSKKKGSYLQNSAVQDFVLQINGFKTSKIAFKKKPKTLQSFLGSLHKVGLEQLVCILPAKEKRKR